MQSHSAKHGAGRQRPGSESLPARSEGAPKVVGFAAAWCAGTLAAHQLPAPLTAGWYVVAALLVLLALGLPRGRWLIGLVAAFVWTAQTVESRLADRLPGDLSGRDFRVSGWIDGFPRGTAARMTFSLRVVAADDERVPRRLRLSWYRPLVGLEPGTGLSVVVRLRPPRGFANPGGFDYERWALVAGYGATGYVRSGQADADRPAALGRRWLRVRSALAARIAAAAPSENASALLTALALGERFRFSDEHWRVLRRTGTSHLVAISGLHIGLVAALTFMLTRRLWLRLPVAWAIHDLPAAVSLSFAAAAAYAALAGFTVPTQRALIMLAVALAAVAGRRCVGPLNGIALAVVFVLLWDPLAPLSASFWLSFVAVGVLLLLAERGLPAPTAERAGRIRTAGRALLRVQWGVTLGLAPAVIVFFNELSLAAPLTNLVAIPYFSFALVPMTLLAAAAAGAGAFESVLVPAAGRLADAGWFVLRAAADWPWAAIALPAPAPWALAAAALGAASLLLAHALPGRLVGGLALLALLEGYGGRPAAGTARVTVLEVGHGLAVVIETHRHALLYDAGPRYPSGFDSGAQIVLPAVVALGLGRLDRLVVSHRDLDHAGGVDAVLAAYPRLELLAGPDVERTDAQRCRAGQTWVWDQVAFSVLHPPADYAARGNDSSCVLRVETRRGAALLLTGDVEAHAERRLAGPALAADAVIVPHHGSATSSSAAFVARVAPRLAIVSAGFENRWGFPRPDVRARWERAGATLLVTGESGAITVELDSSDGLRVFSERGGVLREAGKTLAVPGESTNGAL